jgi:transcriptional regulator with XRE-family HTH domain
VLRISEVFARINYDGIMRFLARQRKRRKLTTAQVAERANIDRTTLYYIEQGKPSVSIGNYFNVLRALNLHEEFLKIAADDPLGRKLQDMDL